MPERAAHRARARRLGRAVALLLAAAALPAVVASCDPCAGVVGCRSDAHVSQGGRIVDHVTGRGVAGVELTFRRTDGPELAQPALVARTDADGWYRLASAATAAGTVVGDLTIAPPAPLAPYTVRGVRLPTTTVRGGGGVLETWTAQPHVYWVGSLVMRRGAGLPVIWGTAVFERRGGARLADGDRIVGNVDPNGYFLLEATARDTGEVVGDLTLTGPGLARGYQLQDVRLRVRVADRPPTLDRVFQIGATIAYAVELRRRGTWAPVAGAEVEFRRTGGLPLASPVVTGRTDATGRVVIAPEPAGEAGGEVVGDLTVSGGGLARPRVVRGLRLRSFDQAELRFAGVFGVGPAAQVAGELFFRGDGSPVTDADVRFERTGGLPSTPAAFDARPIATGYFGIGVATDTVGEVVGDITVRRPGAATPSVFRGVRLRATDDDSVRFAGRFGVGPYFGYAGMLVERATGAPAAGWTVIFRRTGGIPLVVDTLASTVLDWGGFTLAPRTRTTGTVEGTLSARPPEGGAEVPVGTVSLATFDADTVYLAGRWAVGPSLLYVGEVLRLDTGAPVAGARAEFRRTGGISTVETVVGERTNAVGRFRMAPTPLARGEVVGDVYVFPPPPLRDTVFRDVRLRTFDTDETRLHTVWRLAPP